MVKPLSISDTTVIVQACTENIFSVFVLGIGKGLEWGGQGQDGPKLIPGVCPR